MVTRTYILDEIKRTARENGGVPLGRRRFAVETGLKEQDWSGRYWARWGDALKEAGFRPNQLQVRLNDSLVLEKLALLIRELGRLPVEMELRMRRRDDLTFPSHNTFKRFGPRAKLTAAVAAWCQEHPGYDNVAKICAASDTAEPEAVAPRPRAADTEFGSVYLLKSGRYYKIGRSNAVGRRERELAIQLPERATVVHNIKTDDPAGIEFYWHRRFETRRKNGEWFQLTAEDVSAFKRRRFM